MTSRRVPSKVPADQPGVHDRQGADAPEHPGALAFPKLDWVYTANRVLGEVAPGVRDLRFMGVDVKYRPWDDLWKGARWCSKAWLARQDVGRRGPLIRHQGGTSRRGMQNGGAVTGSVVILVPEDQVDVLAGVASYLITRAAAGFDDGISEWSLALVREPTRSRLALGISGSGDAAHDLIRSEVDVEWIIRYWSGHTGADPAPDTFSISTADESARDERIGDVCYDTEPMPHRGVEIAARHGDGLDMRRSTGAFIEVPWDAPYRPLEPDELDDDHDLHPWTGTHDWPGRDQPARPRKTRPRGPKK